MKWLNAALVVSLLALAGCTRGGGTASSPEGALDQYVHAAFSGKEDASDKMLDLSTGEAKEWLSSMSKEAFKKQFVDNHMQLVSFSAKDKTTEANGDVSLVYELTFKDGSSDGKPTSQAVYSLKKIAYLSRATDDKGTATGGWKIRATKNVKTFIERKEALDVMSIPLDDTMIPYPSDTADKKAAAGGKKK